MSSDIVLNEDSVTIEGSVYLPAETGTLQIKNQRMHPPGMEGQQLTIYVDTIVVSRFLPFGLPPPPSPAMEKPVPRKWTGLDLVAEVFKLRRDLADLQAKVSDLGGTSPTPP